MRFGPGAGSGAASWRVHFYLTLLLILGGDVRPAQGTPGSPPSAGTEQAQREVFTALAVGNPAHAEEILERAFRAAPDPIFLYQMGLVAQAQGRQIAALDHYRRYQTIVGAASAERFSKCSAEMQYLDVNAGQVAATGTTESLDCSGPALTDGLAAVIERLLSESDRRQRGMVSVSSTPEGAQVRVDGLLRGQTPYLHASFTGPHEIVVEKEGFRPFRTRADVALGAVAAVRAELVAEPREEPKPVPETDPPRGAAPVPVVKMMWIDRLHPRPRWRLALGGVAIGSGVLLSALGISALPLDGRCVMVPAEGNLCDEAYSTTAAVANYGSSSLSILFGTGLGTFAPAISVGYGCGPQAILAGNFTADQKLDLAIVNLSDNRASVSMNLAQ